MRILIDMQSLQTASRLRGIGRYSLSLAKAMAEAPRGHQLEFLLNAAFADNLEAVREELCQFADRRAIHVWQPPSPASAVIPAHAARRAAGLALRRYVVENLSPDIFHVTSLFEGPASMTPIRLEGIGKAVTQYDLVPLLNIDQYLIDPTARRYYQSQVDELKTADILLAISDYARREAIETLGLAPERVTAISGDADAIFRPLALSPQAIADGLRPLGLNPGFLLYAGNVDARKNPETLIKGYARLPAELRRSHQLVLVSGFSGERRWQLDRLCRRCGLAEGEVRMVGRVDDETLVFLYNACEAFVFPSLHEGFGLPVLEAMRCGAPVIAANTTSIPEVLGLDEALFDPTSPAAIAEKLTRLLTDRDWAAALRAHVAMQAKKFSWAECARRGLEAFEAFHERQRRPVTVPAGKHLLRLAVIAAAVDPEWLEPLRRHYSVEVIRDPAEVRASRHDRRLYVWNSSQAELVTPNLLAERPGTLLLCGGADLLGPVAGDNLAALEPLVRLAQGVVADSPATAEALTGRLGPCHDGGLAIAQSAPLAETLLAALEHFAEDHPLARRSRLIANLRELPSLSLADRAALAIAIDEATPCWRPRQIFVTDAPPEQPPGLPGNWRLVPVRRQGDIYVADDGEPVAPRPDDIFFAAPNADEPDGWLAYHRLRGMRICSVARGETLEQSLQRLADGFCTREIPRSARNDKLLP